MAVCPSAALVALFLLALLAGCASADIVVPCPIDCGTNANVQAQIDVCILVATIFNEFITIVPQSDFQELLDTTAIDQFAPITFVFNNTEFVDRVPCNGLVSNETDVNGTTIFVCVRRFFAYIDPKTTINVQLTGSCPGALLSFPAVDNLNFAGAPGNPAVVLGGNIATDPNNPSNTTFTNIIFNGGGTTDPFFANCMQNGNFTFNNVTFANFAGPTALAMESCLYENFIEMNNVFMQDITGSALSLKGYHNARINGLTCARCGQLEDSRCVSIFMSPASRGNLLVFQVNCYRVQDLLPARCRYCLTGAGGFCGERCNEGRVQVYDRINTAALGTCPQIDLTFVSWSTGMPVVLPGEYDPICRVWRAPQCNPIQLANSQNFTNRIALDSGDIIWSRDDIPDYEAPLYCVAGGVISSLGPFFVTQFTNRLGDPVPVTPLPPLPIPPQLNDPSFELFGTAWTQSQELSGAYSTHGTQGNLNVPNPFFDPASVYDTIDKGLQDMQFSPVEGDYAMRGDNGIKRSVEQVITITSGGIFSVVFAMARGEGMRFLFGTGPFIRVYLNNVVVSTFSGSTVATVMDNKNQWYGFATSAYNATAGTYLMRFEVDLIPQNPTFLTSGYDNLRPEGQGFPGFAVWSIADGGFEPRSLVWSGVGNENIPGQPPIYEVGSAGDTANCGARTGKNRMICTNGFQSAGQTVFFPNPGVYGIRGFAQRRQGLSDFNGQLIAIRHNGVQVGGTLIDSFYFPNQDENYFINFRGLIVVNSPGNQLIEIVCQFGPPTGNPTVKVCIDDVEIEPLGVVGFTPSNLGFRDGRVSSDPQIENQTCICNQPPPVPRDPILLPCLYEITPLNVCNEEVPRCCSAQYLGLQPFMPSVFSYGCDDITKPNCTFLIGCNFNKVTGTVTDCVQYQCPNVTGGPISAGSLSDIGYFLQNCAQNIVQVVNNTVVPSSTLVPGLTYGVTGQVFYPPAIFNNGFVLVDQPSPHAYYFNCSEGTGLEDGCEIYVGCNPPAYDSTAPSGFTLTGCTLLNCSLLDETELNVYDFYNLQLCPTVSSGNVVQEIDAALQVIPLTTLETIITVTPVLNTTTNVTTNYTTTVIRPIRYSLQATEAAFLAWFNAWYVDLQQTSISMTPYAQGGVSSGCQPFALFRQCPCNASGTYVVPWDADTTGDNKITPDYYTCTNGVASCSCDPTDISISNVAPNGTVGLYIELAGDEMATVRIQDNRMQQYQDCVVIEQLSHQKVVNNSIIIPGRNDDRGTIRLLLQNDNEFMTCSQFDGVQGNQGGVYTTTCNIVVQNIIAVRQPCPQTLTSEDDADCIVDDRATEDIPGFGITLFSRITDALAGALCDVVYVRANFQTYSGSDVELADGTYFEEDINFNKATRRLVLFSVDEPKPVILGKHTFDTNSDNVTLIGIRFVHPADNQQPLFRVQKVGGEKNMDSVVIQNCILQGSGCRKCGVFQTDRVDSVSISHSRITQWSFFMIKFVTVNNFNFTSNVVDEATGRVILVKYVKGFVFSENLFKNVRGEEGLSGTVIVSLTATDENACGNLDGPTTCLFRENIQNVDNITDSTPLFKDGCFYISRGGIRAMQIYDNACRIAKTGFVFVKTPLIGPAQVPLLMGLNPYIKNSLTQKRGVKNFRKFAGPDWTVRSNQATITSSGSQSFNFATTLETDFDTNPYFVQNRAPICQSNHNWHPRFHFGSNGNFDLLRGGYELFLNTSIMVDYCTDRGVFFTTNGTQLTRFIGYVDSSNGSRTTLEKLTIRRNCWLMGQDKNSCCKSPLFRPAGEGGQHQIQTEYFNMTMLTWYLDPAQTGNMWNCRPADYQPEDLTLNAEPLTETIPIEMYFDWIEWNGRALYPTQHIYALDCLMGVPIPARYFKTKTNQVPFATSSVFWLTNSMITNFLGYDPDLELDGFTPDPENFPHIDGIKVEFYNRVNTSTTVYIGNFTAQDVDFGALTIAHMSNLTMEYSRFFNCSGRSYGNFQCIKFIGNDITPLLKPSKRLNTTALFYDTKSYVNVHNFTVLNTYPVVLYPYNNRLANPGMLAGLTMSGFPNNTDYCVYNWTLAGLPLGFRQENTLNTTFVQCSRYTNSLPPIVFPDRLRYLRAHCIAGRLWDIRGIIHDLADGKATTDVHAETLWCDSLEDFQCCPLVDPTECYVVQTPLLLAASNPWLDVYIFRFLNDAIQFCNATQRLITVLGSGDPFETGDTAPKIFTEVIAGVVPLAWANAAGPLTIRATAGVTWSSQGNSLDTQGIRVSFEGFRFDQPGFPFPLTPIWNQPTIPGTNLRFTGNIFQTRFDAHVMVMLAGDNFKMQSNKIRGSDQNSINDPRFGVRITGTCAEINVVVKGERYQDFRGYGLYLADVQQYEVQNNRFSNVGGQDFVTQTPYSVFVDDCPVQVGPQMRDVIFKNNLVRTTQVVTLPNSLMSTCWIGHVSRAIKTYDIYANDCQGLDTGLRLQNLVPNNSPSDDRKQLLRFFSRNEFNIRSRGRSSLQTNQKRFDIISTNPADDFLMVADPDSNTWTGFWCTDGCPSDTFVVYGVLIALAAAALASCLLCYICTCGCNMALWKYFAADFPIKRRWILDPRHYAQGHIAPRADRSQEKSALSYALPNAKRAGDREPLLGPGHLRPTADRIE
jgi:hypothetical protein